MKHTHISAEHKLLDLKLKDVWTYRDLIRLFVRRSFTVSYKQTVLGPLWLILAPFLTSLMYVVLFGNIAKLSTDGVPQILFYMSGTALWGFFSGCVSKNSSTFTANAGLFGKVYFPRLVVPVSNTISGLIQFGIQLLFILVLYFYFLFRGAVQPDLLMLPLLPLTVCQLGLLGIGFGIIVSSFTTKYRDLAVLVSFGLQLWMFASPIVYPVSSVSGVLRTLILINPVSAPTEIFRSALFGTGTVEPWSVALSLILTLFTAAFGIVIFNKVERTFMDTV